MRRILFRRAVDVKTLRAVSRVRPRNGFAVAVRTRRHDAGDAMETFSNSIWPYLALYKPTLAALAAMGGLLLIQLSVADFFGIRERHPAGHPVTPDPAKIFFRTTRAAANTNESIAVFILLALAGILIAANAVFLNGFAWLYVAGRIAHMIAYYANQARLRSAFFGVAVLGLVGMLATVVPAFWA